MARRKPVQRNGMFVPVLFAERIQLGNFERAPEHLVERELNLSTLGTRFRNDATGASAYDPRFMLKILRLTYSGGLLSSRLIEQACETTSCLLT